MDEHNIQEQYILTNNCNFNRIQQIKMLHLLFKKKEERGKKKKAFSPCLEKFQLSKDYENQMAHKCDMFVISIR